MTSDEIRETFLSFFESRDHRRLASGSLIPADYDPSVLLTTAGMHPLKPYFQGREHAAAHPPDVVPEVLPHARHRGGRADHAAPDVLRDARQLLDRRLLQAGRRGVRLGAVPRGLRLPRREDLGHRLRRRRGARPRPRPGGHRRVAGDRRAARAHRRAPALGELLAGRPDRPVRPVLGALPRPRAGLGHRGRPARRRERALPRVLEPRLHAARSEPARTCSRRCRPRTSTPASASTGWR